MRYHYSLTKEKGKKKSKTNEHHHNQLTSELKTLINVIFNVMLLFTFSFFSFKQTPKNLCVKWRGKFDQAQCRQFTAKENPIPKMDLPRQSLICIKYPSPLHLHLCTHTTSNQPKFNYCADYEDWTVRFIIFYHLKKYEKKL